MCAGISTDAMNNTGKFVIAIPILNQFDEAYTHLDSWFNLAKGRLNVIFIDNGSEKPWEEHTAVSQWREDGHEIRVCRNEENVGVYPTFHQVYDLIFDEAWPWIFYSHSDVEMLAFGWDERLRQLLEAAASRNAGVCGMFGARGIGTPDIYTAPYHFTQMMRWDCHTVQSMAGAGGEPVKQDLTQCMVLDGFSLIVNFETIKSIGGFDHERYPVHHMYDNDICLESHFAGFKNYVLDIDCIHHGGMTSTREKWAEEMGTTDLSIHRESHKVFYEKWRGRLPVSV